MHYNQPTYYKYIKSALAFFKVFSKKKREKKEKLNKINFYLKTFIEKNEAQNSASRNHLKRNVNKDCVYKSYMNLHSFTITCHSSKKTRIKKRSRNYHHPPRESSSSVVFSIPPSQLVKPPSNRYPL